MASLTLLTNLTKCWKNSTENSRQLLQGTFHLSQDILRYYSRFLLNGNGNEISSKFTQ